MKMWVKILIAIGLGIATGLAMGPQAEIFKPIGTIFINLLKMVIVPLIFSSMIMGVSSTDPKRLGRVGIRAIGLYALFTVLALSLGITVSSLLGLGKSMHLVAAASSETKNIPSLVDMFVSIVPKNPIASFAEGNVLQILFFAVLFGISLNALGDFGKPVVHFFEVVAHLMFRMTSMIMNVAPIGVFALMAWATGSFGLEVLVPVFKFLGSYIGACIIFSIVVYGTLLMGIAKLSPLPLVKGIAEALATGASTCSSSATLPLTIQSCVKNLGMNQKFATFVLPLGCSLNLNGSALFQAMSAIFIAEAYGVDLTSQHIMLLGMTIVFATFGTAAIPSGGLIMLSIVFTSVGIPLEGIAILASVDRLRDMVSTMLNITGDVVTATFLAQGEGELDKVVYNSETVPIA
jgi:Na+/H+-dicarboxylate symporter